MLDDQIHYFISSGPDHSQANITQEALYGINTGITNAPHNLHGIIDDFPGGLGSKFLGALVLVLT